MEASEPIRHPDALNEHGEMSDFPESVMFTSSLCPSPCRTGRDIPAVIGAARRTS